MWLYLLLMITVTPSSVQEMQLKVVYNKKITGTKCFTEKDRIDIKCMSDKNLSPE